jgi:hypothetical protein
VADKRVVEVILIDGTTGQEIGRRPLPPDQLPDTFATQTTVELDGTTWLVERAEPADAVRFRAGGVLVLTLRHLDRVPASDILYSLPTICDVLPGTENLGEMPDRLEIHEDDWRQVEMVSADLSKVVDAQLRSIRVIYQEHARRDTDGRVTGFDDIHVRSDPVRPLPIPLPRGQLLSMLPSADREHPGVAFIGTAGVVVGSFAIGVGGVGIYGQARDDAIHILCLRAEALPPLGISADLIASLEQIMRAFGIIIVDWCRCLVIEPGSVGDYLGTW